MKDEKFLKSSRAIWSFFCSFATAVLATSTLIQAGCSVGPGIGDTYAVNTPTVYTENRVYFIGDPIDLRTHDCCARRARLDAPHRPLLHPYEIPGQQPLLNDNGAQTAPGQELDHGQPFDRNDPVASLSGGAAYQKTWMDGET